MGAKASLEKLYDWSAENGCHEIISKGGLFGC